MCGEIHKKWLETSVGKMCVMHCGPVLSSEEQGCMVRVQ